MAMTASERVKKCRLKDDRFEIRPSLEKGAEIRAAAKASGESIAHYILQAIEMRMEQEKKQ